MTGRGIGKDISERYRGSVRDRFGTNIRLSSPGLPRSGAPIGEYEGETPKDLVCR